MLEEDFGNFQALVDKERKRHQERARSDDQSCSTVLPEESDSSVDAFTRQVELERQLKNLSLYASEKDTRRKTTFSNLVLVHTFLEELLHPSAYIAAKRNWISMGTVDEELPEADKKKDGCPMVATWSLGFWLQATKTKNLKR